MNDRKGFTLVEVIVILVVLSILAAIAVPLVLRIFTVTAENTTNTEMQNLKNAMIGDPDKLASSQRSDFGYVGDMGCLPSSIQDLLTKPSGAPNYSFNSTVQIGAGWRGPYITGAASGQETDTFTKDEWGNSYSYTVSGGCPLTATFISNGPDAALSTSDDINYSIASSDTTSTVSGYIKDANGNPVGSSTVTINYPGGSAGPGNLTTSTTTANSSGFYSFSNVPFGNRSVKATPKLIVTSARALAPGTDDPGCNTGPGNCTLVEFNLVNFTTSSVSVSSLKADYTSTPAAVYYKIVWGSTTVFECTGSGCSAQTGDTVTFSSSQTIAAASTALAPFVFVVDNSQKQLADIQLGKRGEVGTSVRVRIINFRTCTNGVNCGGNPSGQVDMRGITFTITLSDGSVVKFTP